VIFLVENFPILQKKFEKNHFLSQIPFFWEKKSPIKILLKKIAKKQEVVSRLFVNHSTRRNLTSSWQWSPLGPEWQMAGWTFTCTPAGLRNPELTTFLRT
jgi:hypothetical protein